jgi:hypothetical protein
MGAAMKVEQPDLRSVQWDCPWTGHAYGEGGVEVRNSTRPDIVGMQCVKCGALIYERVKARVPVADPLSGAPLLVGPSGAPVLVTAAREGGD